MVGELGDDLGLVPSTASRLSDRLAEAGLITRRPAPSNRRSTLLELTDAGRAILDELVALRIRAFREVADQMSNQDRAALIQGAHAFTAAQQRSSDKSSKQRARVPPSQRQALNVDLAVVGGTLRDGLSGYLTNWPMSA